MTVIVTVAFLFWKGYDIDWYVTLFALMTFVLFQTTSDRWNESDAKIIRAVSSFVLSLYLVVKTGLPMLYILLGVLVCLILYRLLRTRAAGRLFLISASAFLPALAASVAAIGQIDFSVLIVALPVGLMLDKGAGEESMRNGVTLKSSAVLYSFELMFPYAWLAVCSILGFMPLATVMAFMTFPMAVACSKTMMNSADDNLHLAADMDSRTVSLHLAFSIIFALAFVVSKVHWRIFL